MENAFLKLFFTQILLTCFLQAFAGDNESYYSTKKIDVYSTKFIESRVKVKSFIEKNKFYVFSLDENEDRFSSEFVIPNTDLAMLDSFAGSLGFIVSNNYTSINIESTRTRLKNELEDEEINLKDEQREAVEIGVDKTIYAEIKTKIDYSELHIRNLKRELSDMNGKDAAIRVTLIIYDDIGSPESSGNTELAFVNMPGFEYGYLLTENPKAGLSSKAYESYAIKYMFTRGKSYFTIGVMRDMKPSKMDSSRISELFLVNFGQDFYPRHFGRGKRKFLNLYTGYQIGGFVSHRNDNAVETFVPDINLSMGLELFKSRNILFDTKANYFLPLNNLNYNLRGFLFNGSFNFVF